MITKHIVARCRQLAAWYDPATREQPQFPFAPHEFLRAAVSKIEELDAHLAAALRVNKAEPMSDELARAHCRKYDISIDDFRTIEACVLRGRA